MDATALLELLVNRCLFLVSACDVVGMLLPPPLQVANVNASHPCRLILTLSPSVNRCLSTVSSFLPFLLLKSLPMDCKFLLYFTFLLRSLSPGTVPLPRRCRLINRSIFVTSQLLPFCLTVLYVCVRIAVYTSACCCISVALPLLLLSPLLIDSQADIEKHSLAG